MEALIERFIKDTGALGPRPNPDYIPQAAPSGRDAAKGLVPKMSRISVASGALRVEAAGRTPFLGTAQARCAGPIKAFVRLRSVKGGKGKFTWMTEAQDEFPRNGQSVGFEIPAGGEWADIEVMPASPSGRISER